MSAPNTGIGIDNPETGLAGGGEFIDASEVGQPNGIATLDGSGKIPTSQMPVGDVTYKGNWNATTNAPTLVNGTGVAGDLYICDVAGTRDLGGGSVAYSVGDWLIYDGAVWDRVPGAGAAPANPSVTVGLTAKNGTAPTFMRSDAAPALDQAIAPTWTGIHTFGAALSFTGTSPWTLGGTTGTAGQVLASTGNATQPAWTNTPTVVAADGKVTQAANVSVPALYAVPVSGMYRVSVFLVVSQAATTSSVLPSCSVSYTEATTGAAVADLTTQTASTNLVGLHTSGTAVVQAQAGSNIGYSTGSYASSGATPMQYSVQVKVERVG